MTEHEAAEFVLKRGRYLLNTDGGMVNDGKRSSDDEPGEAAIGVVLRDADDRPVTAHKESIGQETIQGAEYRALIKGLEMAIERGIGKIRVYVDNQFVVDQVNDLAAVNSERLIPLHRKALELLGEFEDQRVYWVPRERNKEADGLVREALQEI